jgi:septum formation inhibitor MinC
MFQLDDNLLQELGLGSLPVADKNKMLGHIYETLELRVGMRLAEQMSDEQLDEFEGFIDRNDEAGALHWLETNFPDYKKVVAEELEKLKNEIKAQAPAILEATRAEMQANAQAQQPQNPYQQPMQPPQNPYQQQQPPQQYPQQPQDPNSGYTQPPQNPNS